VKALEEGVGGDSIAGNNVRQNATTPDIDEEGDDDGVPILLNPDYPNFRAILAKCDVIVHILDVRDPLAFRSSHLEELVRGNSGQKLMLVLNKIGTLLLRPLFSPADLYYYQTLAPEKTLVHGQLT
jgi:predicted GTPase